jgi:hypothetical protein
MSAVGAWGRPRWAGAFGLCVVLATLGGLLGGVAEAQAATLYAYAGGTSAGASCPQTATTAVQCSLGTALTDAKAGDTVMLATPGQSAGGGNYIGNWSIGTTGTSASEPVTIDGSGVTDATLDGNGGSATGCTTGTCNGPILFVQPSTYVRVQDLTIQNADNTMNGVGGGIDNAQDGTVTVANATLTDNIAVIGAGIENSYNGPSESTLAVTDSTFTGNTSVMFGGAIDNGDDGAGTATITDSTFSANQVTDGDGGAVDNGDSDGAGSVTVTGSTFTDNSASMDGGAIDNADNGNFATTLTVTDSTFSGNHASVEGGAIDNARAAGQGSAIVSDSTFSGDQSPTGGEISTSDNGGGSLAVVDSTLDSGGGGDITADVQAGNGEVTVAGDVFASSCQRVNGTWTDDGYNVGADATCFNGGTGDVNAQPPAALGLGPLAGNGGTTQTMALEPGSPAIGIVPANASVTVNANQVSLCSGTDQRGDPRPGSGDTACDAGAFETSLDTVSTAIACTPASLSTGDASTCTATVTDTAASAASTPTGTVMFTTSPSTGAFTGAGNCTLATGTGAGSGAASCQVTFTPSGAGSFTVTGAYGGDDEHQAGSGRSGSIGVLDPISTAIGCTPASLSLGSAITCTATVTDTATNSPSTPTGTITFTASPNTGVFSGSGSCTLAADAGAGVASCQVTFTPSAAASYTVSASYGGDGSHQPSRGSGAGAAGSPVTVTAVLPEDTGAPAISGTPTAGAVLGCSTGQWSGTKPLSYSYQWSRDGTPLVGVTSAVYTVIALDEGTTLTCTVTAANQAGSGKPATSAGVQVPVPYVAACPKASGALAGTRLGLIHLGMTSAEARHAYAHSSSRGQAFEQFFCLTPIGVRVGYASPRLLKTAGAAERRKLQNRVVWASTSDPYFAILGIRPGATLKAAEQRLPHGNLIPIGLNDWYLAPAGASTAVLKVRDGTVQEIGIANRQLTRTRAGQRTLMTSFE